MAREARLDLIRKIEKKRDSKIIAYVTCGRPGLTVPIESGAIPIIERHLRNLATESAKSLDLFLYSRGGDSNLPWSLVSLIREYMGKRPFNVLVPFRAHSAATVVALGADEIVMTRAGELGPIDATIERGPHNPRDPDTKQPLPISVEDARGYFSFLTHMGLDDTAQKMAAFDRLSANVSPLALGSVSRILSLTQKVSEQLLKTRRKPLPEAENAEIVKRLSSEITSHSHTIRLTEASAIGLTFVTPALKAGIEDEMWHLYQEYDRLLSLEEPFAPNDDLIDLNLEEKKWQDMRGACIESTARTDFFEFDLSVRRLRSVPPQVSLNLPNLNLALPPPPLGMDQTQLQNYIETVLKPLITAQVTTAAEAAAKTLQMSLPQQGFEHIQTCTGWIEDQQGT
jgi:hypothetical protein